MFSRGTLKHVAGKARTPRLKLVKRWFYIDIRKAMNPAEDRENAIVSVPEDRRIKSDFDRKIDLDLSTPELEYQNLMFPLNQVFDWDDWQDGFNEYWLENDTETRKLFKPFKDEVLQNFKSYQLPVIALSPDTSHEAVCLVFEKVNTGGKPLDAFELVTAMYAARGHRLRDDWLGADGQPGMQTRLQLYGRAAEQKFGVLEKVAATDVLQAIALLHGAEKRAAEVAAGRKESELSAVRATRQSLLDLPLEAYLKHRGAVEEGFKTAARFLRQNHIYRVIDLPYQGQLVPFAAILAMIGPKFDHAAVRDKLARWFWCGIFGELYGSAIESRFTKDVLEVPAWLDGGPVPSTITDGRFRPERLRTLRTRLGSAKTDIPSDQLILELLRHSPTMLLLDEFQTWYDSLTNTKQYPWKNWAFNFIQILSEIAKEHPELLVLVVSVRNGTSPSYSSGCFAGGGRCSLSD